MNIQLALENIRFASGKLPEKEIICIMEHKEEAIPVLLEYIRSIIGSDRDSLPEDYNAHFFSMFLLAEFRVREAFSHLIKYLEFDSELSEYWLGDTLTECFGSILASVATIDDIPRIKEVIEDAKIYTFQKTAALDALQVLFVEEVYSRDDYLAYLRHLLETCHGDSTVLAHIVISCEKTGVREFLPQIEELYKADLVDELFTTLSEVKRGFLGTDEETAKQALKKDKSCLFFQDTVKYLRGWHCFNEKPDFEHKISQADPFEYKAERTEPFGRKVGRNEPCPCGSGKKYKKCCGF